MARMQLALPALRFLPRRVGPVLTASPLRHPFSGTKHARRDGELPRRAAVPAVLSKAVRKHPYSAGRGPPALQCPGGQGAQPAGVSSGGPGHRPRSPVSSPAAQRGPATSACSSCSRPAGGSSPGTRGSGPGGRETKGAAGVLEPPPPPAQAAQPPRTHPGQDPGWPRGLHML